MPILVLALYIELFVFIIVSAVLIAGQGLVDYALCRAGTWVCLMFYTTIKAIMYFIPLLHSQISALTWQQICLSR